MSELIVMSWRCVDGEWIEIIGIFKRFLCLCVQLLLFLRGGNFVEFWNLKLKAADVDIKLLLLWFSMNSSLWLWWRWMRFCNGDQLPYDMSLRSVWEYHPDADWEGIEGSIALWLWYFRLVIVGKVLMMRFEGPEPVLYKEAVAWEVIDIEMNMVG